jgi:hypothetical protein
MAREGNDHVEKTEMVVRDFWRAVDPGDLECAIDGVRGPNQPMGDADCRE